MAHPPDTGPEDRGLRLPAGLQACQLALSTRTVWARCPNGELARRYGITDKNPAGDYWKRIPGTATCLTGRCWAHRAAPPDSLSHMGACPGVPQGEDRAQGTCSKAEETEAQMGVVCLGPTAGKGHVWTWG